ncbi:OTU-domain-containing protein [Microthyrium microscopicum]|uniref:Ubiquitin thioesterase OTU n=1 Tax=Microthyrium microscopicum TaxID=703497 RepID=A0A6A6U3V5_9PEZI|nr:OTU-domain-containing protein [Microthyrium microscopicum]
MRFRIRAPSGTHTVTLDDNSTVNDLCLKITELTNLIEYDVKGGFPPQPLVLAELPSDTKLADTGYKFNGEQLIIASKEEPGVTQAKATASHSASMTNVPPSSTEQNSSQQKQSFAGKQSSTSSSSTTNANLPSLSRKPNDVESDPPTYEIPTRGGRMVLRVMPDDNSCLFRALSTVLLGPSLDGMTELRSIVAQVIASDPETYSEAVLQRAPDKYAEWIQRPESWGGYVDIKCIAEYLGTEVVGVDVKSGLITRYGEGAAMRAFVVYSGIHYDALAFVPDGCTAEETEFDTKQFPVDDEAYLEAAKGIAGMLKERNYFTDTAGMSIRCGVCGWTGNGEKAATKHAESTGHMDFQEG